LEFLIRIFVKWLDNMRKILLRNRGHEDFGIGAFGAFYFHH
jgi:hypothetical protein